MWSDKFAFISQKTRSGTNGLPLAPVGLEGIMLEREGKACACLSESATPRGAAVYVSFSVSSAMPNVVDTDPDHDHDDEHMPGHKQRLAQARFLDRCIPTDRGSMGDLVSTDGLSYFVVSLWKSFTWVFVTMLDQPRKLLEERASSMSGTGLRRKEVERSVLKKDLRTLSARTM